MNTSPTPFIKPRKKLGLPSTGRFQLAGDDATNDGVYM